MSEALSAAQRSAFEQLPVNRPLYLHLFIREGASTVLAQLSGQGGDCELLTRRELSLVGSADPGWQYYALLRFATPAAACRALQSIRNDVSVEAFAATPPSRVLPRVLALLRPLLSRLPRPSRKGPLPAGYFQGGGSPSVESYRQLEKRSQDDRAALWMVNLNRMHERARRHDDHRALSGAAAYRRYARGVVILIMRFGGHVAWFGRYRFTALGNGGDPAPERWHEIGIVHYPGLAAFQAMLCTGAYQALYPHRHAGLEYAEIAVTRPAKD